MSSVSKSNAAFKISFDTFDDIGISIKDTGKLFNLLFRISQFVFCSSVILYSWAIKIMLILDFHFFNSSSKGDSTYFGVKYINSVGKAIDVNL